MARENIRRASEKESASAAPSPEHKGVASSNGEHMDWLTRELGRRPTWEERVERARAARKRLGLPPPPPRPPDQTTPEERAAATVEGERLSEAIRKDLNGWQFNSVRFFRDLRDGKLKDEPNAYWTKPDHAGD